MSMPMGAMRDTPFHLGVLAHLAARALTPDHRTTPTGPHHRTKAKGEGRRLDPSDGPNSGAPDSPRRRWLVCDVLSRSYISGWGSASALVCARSRWAKGTPCAVVSSAGTASAPGLAEEGSGSAGGGPASARWSQRASPVPRSGSYHW